MKLEPLNQWICDDCEGIILQPSHGMLEWLRDADHNHHSFRIVHNISTPRQETTADCAKHSAMAQNRKAELSEFLGVEGMNRLLLLLHFGSHIAPERKKPRVAHAGEWVELFRRLHIPHYEEARIYWITAHSDEWFGGADANKMYSPATIESLVQAYSAPQ